MIDDREKVERICEVLNIPFEEWMWPKTTIINILLELTDRVIDLEHKDDE